MARRYAMPAILVAALLIRLPFAFLDPVVSADPHQLAGWAATLRGAGMGGLLDSTNAVLYPPLAMLAFWFVGVLQEPLLGVRLLAILGDVCLTAAVAVLLAGHRPRVRISVVAAIAFNPALWYLSAIWGQPDSVYVLFGVASVGWLALGRPVAAASAEGLSIAWKIQGVVLIPVLAAVALRGRRVSSAATALAAGVVAVAIPAALLTFVAGFDSRYVGQLLPPTEPANASAFNLWYVATHIPHGSAAIASAPSVASATGSNSGLAAVIGVTALVVITLVVVTALVRMRSEPNLPLLGLAGATLTIATFVLFVGMKERYLVGAIPLLALSSAGASSGRVDRAAALAFVAITVTETLNLLAVGSFATNLWTDIFAGDSGPLAPAFVALGFVCAGVNLAVLAWCVWRFTGLGARTIPALGRLWARSGAG